MVGCLNKKWRKGGVMKVKANYNGIDLFKFFCALLVVVIHVPPFESINKLLYFGSSFCIARLAVPFFFTATGYLLFKKIDIADIDYSKIYRQIRKLIKFYVIWSLIYLPLVFIEKVQAPVTLEAVFEVFKLWLKNFIFSGDYEHLWYLHATIIALLMICLGFKLKLKPITMTIIGVGLYILGTLNDSYAALTVPWREAGFTGALYDFYGNWFVTPRNGVFDGFLFVCIGMMIAFKPEKMSFKKSSIGFVISVLALVAEFLVISKFRLNWDYNMFFMLPLCAWFMLSTAISLKLPESKTFKEMRIMSNLIYFTHIWVFKLLILLGVVEGYINNSLISFLLVLILTLLLSMVIRKLSENQHFSWLKKLYL